MPAADEIPLRTADGSFQAIVETPRGSRVKYAYDKGTGLFLAKKLLALGFCFPFPFGFLPTSAEDGDPLDVLIVTQFDLPAGTLVRISFAGAIQLEQQTDGKTIRNDRLLGAPRLEGDESRMTNLADVGQDRLREIENFLVGYQQAEGKRIRTVGRLSGADAERMALKHVCPAGN
jgi:inorganic pyrophosphatase